ncbi:MAG: hypothetical protein ACR2G4_14010 [Pyrinomonadaceae bacterium]
MSHVVVIDNQEIPLDAETAASDHEIRQALRWCYPEIANATINRRTEGEREIITVIKRAGTKGSVASEINADGEISTTEIKHRVLKEVCAELRRAPEVVNPAVQLAHELQTRIATGDLTLGELTLMREEMQLVIELGETEESRVEQARGRLVRAPAQASCFVPIGF